MNKKSSGRRGSHYLSPEEAGRLRGFLVAYYEVEHLQDVVRPKPLPPLNNDEQTPSGSHALLSSNNKPLLDVNYRHLVGVLTSKRAFAPSLERQLARAVGFEGDVSKLRAAVNYEPPDGALNEIGMVEDHAERARDRSVRGQHLDSIEDARLVERYYTSRCDWLNAANWAIHQGLDHRFLSAHDAAMQCFARAHRHLEALPSSMADTWDALRLKSRASRYEIWVDKHLRKAALTEARAGYSQLLQSMTKEGGRLCKTTSLLPSDVAIEVSGLRWRMAEIDVIQGDYTRALKEFRLLHKEACTNYDADHAIWSLFGVARAEFMLGRFGSSEKTLKRVLWAATRANSARSRIYAQTTLLQLYIATDRQRDYSSMRELLEQPKEHSPRLRKSIYTNLLEAVWFLIFLPDPLQRVKGFCKSAINKAREIPLEREEAMARLTRAVTLLEGNEVEKAQHETLIAYEKFKAMNCRWGIIRCEVLMRQRFTLSVTPVSTRYQGVDAELKEIDARLKEKRYTKTCTAKEILRCYL